MKHSNKERCEKLFDNETRKQRVQLGRPCMIVLLYAEETVRLSISNAKNTVDVNKLARIVKLPGPVSRSASKELACEQALFGGLSFLVACGLASLEDSAARFARKNSRPLERYRKNRHPQESLLAGYEGSDSKLQWLAGRLSLFVARSAR